MDEMVEHYLVFREDRQGHEAYVSSHLDEEDAVEMARRLIEVTEGVGFYVMTTWMRRPQAVGGSTY